MTSPRPAQGRQLKIGVTFLAWLNIYQTTNTLFRTQLRLKSKGSKARFKVSEARSNGLSDRIDSLEKRLGNRIDGLEKRMDDPSNISSVEIVRAIPEFLSF